MVDLEPIAADRPATATTRRGRSQRALGVDDTGMGDMLRFDAERLRILVERHLCTPAARAPRELLDDWDEALDAVRQGDADGLPPRAAATCEAERRAAAVVAAE